MIELVRHTLVDSAVHLDIHIVADLVGPEIGRQGDVPLLPEWPGEEVPSPRPDSMARRHLLRRLRENEKQKRTVGEKP